MKSLIRLTIELMALTIAALPEEAAAISCYQCIYTDTELEVSSTCIGFQSGIPTLGRCSGSICRTRWAEFSSPSNNHRDHECIDGGGDGASLPPTTIDRCGGKTTNNESYFVYGGQCCFTSGEVLDYGTRYMVTECFCQRDFCNAVVSSPVIDSSYSPTTNNPGTGQWTASPLSTFSSASMSPRNQSTITTQVHLYYTTLSNGTNSSSSSSSWSSATSVVHLTLIDTLFIFVFW